MPLHIGIPGLLDVYCALQVGCQSALPAKLHKTIQPDNQPAKHNSLPEKLSQLRPGT